MLNTAPLTLGADSDYHQQPRQILALTSGLGVEKRLCLGQGVIHQLCRPVTGSDQAGDGIVPAGPGRARRVGSRRRAAT